MSDSPEGEASTAAEILAEMTGRPVEQFELPDDVEFPDLDELEEVSAEEFYADGDSKAVEEAFHAVDSASARLATLQETIPRLEADGEWSPKAIEGVNSHLEEIRSTVQSIGDDVNRAYLELYRLRKLGSDEEDDRDE